MPLPNVISLPVRKAAELTGRSRQLLYAAIRNGHLKAYRPTSWAKDDGEMVVMVEDLESWLKANPVQAGVSDGAA